MLSIPRLSVIGLFLSLSLTSASPQSYPANLAAVIGSAVGKFTGESTISSSAQAPSQDLVAMLNEAKLAASSPRPSPSATSSASSTGVSPSSSLDVSARAARRAAKRNLELLTAKIRETPWQELDSRLLCPTGATACPIFPRMGSWECIDTEIELESCGGCASRSEGEDCTRIKGAQGVTCSSGQCLVFSCQPGYELRKDSKGRDRCKRDKTFAADK